MEKQDCLVRLRLRFERRRVLTKQQRLEGLSRCWFILRSELSTVSDLACDITHAFRLQSACPDGLLLSMDGFVLPPFVSTDIFRDNDLIRVRKNKGSGMKTIPLQDGDDNMGQTENAEGTLEKQPHLTRIPILAVEQFQKESGGCQTDEEDDLVDKLEEPKAPPVNSSPVTKATEKKKRKRKDSDPSSSKIRKHKPNDSENLTRLLEGRQTVTVENDCCCSLEDNTRDVQGDHKLYNGCDAAKAGPNSKFNSIKEDEYILSEKRRKKKKKTRDQAVIVEDIEAINQEEVSLHHGADLSSKPSRIHKSPDGNDINMISDEGGDDMGDGGNDFLTGESESLTMVKRQECLQEKSEGAESEPQVNGEVKKVSSRSARRKKAKRKWLREAKLNASKLEELPNNHKNNGGCSETPDIAVTSAGNTEDAVIPIVVRPGHIRFEDSDEDIIEVNGKLHAKETYHLKSTGDIEWNGPLDKKKGQKWGRMRTSSSCTWNSEKIPQDGPSKGNPERKAIFQPEDFEKLSHITGSPKVGDVLAYRLIELSSSWCPEVSSFRVGQVTSYDPVTTNCTLVPVPGYEIPLNKAAEESEMLPEQSVYNDDGSLEIGFTSLVDVRLLEGAESGVTSETSCRVESIEAGPSNLGNSRGEEIYINSGEETPSEKKAANGWKTWEDIQRALEKKKAELQQQDGGDKREKKESAAKPSWSHRALRGSALGPTISLLRANNAL